MSRSPFGRFTYTIVSTIDKLHTKVQSLKPLDFTYDEMLALLSPPEHWPILKQAAEVSTTQGSGGYHEVQFNHPSLRGKVELLFQVSNRWNPPLMPRNTDVLPSAPPELLEKLAAWTSEQLDYALQFKRAKQLFYWLDANMATKDQIRFVWPVVVNLCSKEEYTAPLVDKLREFKPQRTLPHIPMEVRKAARETSGLLTSVCLLDDNVLTTRTAPQVDVTFRQAAFHERIIDGALGDITP